MSLYEKVGDGIYVIETNYLSRRKFACCYLIEENGEAAIIETNTNYAVPYILDTLEKVGIERNKVKYVILTHIHLDHAGGTGELMRHLPEARLVVHPRGKKHMIDPEKLIESVKEVYGIDRYKEMYGEIQPVPKEKVIAANDGDSISLGARQLQFFDTPGHAKHHMIIFDRKTMSVFSGDNFGIGYPRMIFDKTRLLFPSTSPTQFEPDKALETYQKIMSLNPSQVLLTHWGPVTDLQDGLKQLHSWLEFMVDIAKKHFDEGYRDKELNDILRLDIENRFKDIILSVRGQAATDEEMEWLAMDSELNAQGLALYISKPNG